MGKPKPKRQRRGDVSKPKRRNLGPQSPVKNPGTKPLAAQSQTKAQHAVPTIPFLTDDRILLIGEADLSFARSLIEHHSCQHVTATVLEKDLEELAGKYPHVTENVVAIEDGGGKVVYGVDATRMGPWVEGKERVGVMDKVVFNFPHVGGKSTDVNRQVRYNQGMNAMTFVG